MKQKDIYWVNLDPIKGKEQSGRRPVVIISGNTMNENLGVLMICPITTKIKNFTGCVVLGKNKNNGLSQDSEIIVFQARTVARERLGKKIGEITNSELEKIFEGLHLILRN